MGFEGAKNRERMEGWGKVAGAAFSSMSTSTERSVSTELDVKAIEQSAYQILTEIVSRVPDYRNSLGYGSAREFTGSDAEKRVAALKAVNNILLRGGKLRQSFDAARSGMVAPDQLKSMRDDIRFINEQHHNAVAWAADIGLLLGNVETGAPTPEVSIIEPSETHTEEALHTSIDESPTNVSHSNGKEQRYVYLINKAAGFGEDGPITDAERAELAALELADQSREGVLAEEIVEDDQLADAHPDDFVDNVSDRPVSDVDAVVRKMMREHDQSTRTEWTPEPSQPYVLTSDQQVGVVPLTLNQEQRVDRPHSETEASVKETVARVDAWLQEIQYRGSADGMPDFEPEKDVTLQVRAQLNELKNLILRQQVVSAEQLTAYKKELADAEMRLHKAGVWLYEEPNLSVMQDIVDPVATSTIAEAEQIETTVPTEAVLRSELDSTGLGDGADPGLDGEIFGPDESLPHGTHEENLRTIEDAKTQLLGLSVPRAGAQGVFGARAFREALELMRYRIDSSLTAQQREAFDAILSLVEYVPKAGLSEATVQELETRMRALQMPRSPYRFTGAREVVTGMATAHEVPPLAEAYEEKSTFSTNMRNLGYVAALAAAAGIGGVTGIQAGKKGYEFLKDNGLIATPETPVAAASPAESVVVTDDGSLFTTEPLPNAETETTTINPEVVTERNLEPLPYTFNRQRGVDGELIDTVSEAVYDEWKKQPSLVKRELTRTEFLTYFEEMNLDLQKNPAAMNELATAMKLRSGNIGRVFEQVVAGSDVIDLAPLFAYLNEHYL